ncbi:MAG: recombinase zinc beta ribbon domain-containing protein [Chloroflexia bacterium]|nr:recombinase zinc beta ribbon domain-containing protein [Chloroflexia bacterium]
MRNGVYLGELPDGDGGWLPCAHEPVLDDELFDREQRARSANRRASGALSVSRTRRIHSLSGLGVCGRCGGRLHIQTDRHGKARVYCYRGRQADRCGQRSAHLDGIEAQLAAYLETFSLPDETIAAVVRMHEVAGDRRDDGERRRREIEGRLDRIKQLYGWGDLTRSAYVSERDHLEIELATLAGSTDRAAVLVQAAAFLRDLPAAWSAADPGQRNALARLIFESVEIVDDRVAAVVPRADFAPFFVAGTPVDGSSGEKADGADDSTPSNQVLTGRKRRDSNPRSQP